MTLAAFRCSMFRLCRSRIRVSATLWLCLVSGAASAAQPHETQAEADVAGRPPPAEGALDLAPCDLIGSRGYGRVAVECGRLQVPENPDDPSGRTLELFVARVRALSPDARADPLTIINGGPGASSVSLYVDLEGAFRDVLRRRDIVLVDQRGTGRSNPLDCAALEAASQEYAPDRIRAATRECLAGLAADPRFYTTSIAVQDLDRVRRALGYATWNLYGVSYGTRVAQHYLRRYPDAVRTLTIDGVVPPEYALGPDIALNAQATLDDLFRRCGMDAACADVFPGIAQRFSDLGRALKDGPVSLDLPDPVTGRSQPFELTYEHLAVAVRLLSYAPETAALVPVMIQEAAERGNYVPIAAQAMRIEEELTGSISFGMHNSVVCAEDVPFYQGLDALWPTLDATYLGADQVRALQTICSVWPKGPVDADLRTPLSTDKPVLLLSGEHDPITPPAYAEQARTDMRNSRHLIAPGQGHGVIGRGCISALLGDFVETADLGSLDAACVDRLGDAPFFLDLLGPAP
ncbi:MAG: alpha/beta hydrolase [Pseudomonadales bacterium]